MTNISVIGCGRWGTFLGWYMATYRVDNVLMYDLPTSPNFIELKETRKNNYLTLQDNMEMTSNMEEILKNDFIIISIGAQYFRGLCKELQGHDLTGKTFLLAMKGLEQDTSKRLSVVMKEEIDQDIKVAVLAGPGHVQDYIKGAPSCVVIDSESEELKDEAVQMMNSELVRCYYGTDIAGTEIGAALKNVIGVAAGILDGIGYQGLKGALMARAPVEVGRFMEAMGGDPRSAYGLAHLGDYEATLFSKYSHNRGFGELFAKGEKFDKLAEGVYTLKGVHKVSVEQNIDMPICNAIYKVIYENGDLKEEISKLFTRRLTKEF